MKLAVILLSGMTLAACDGRPPATWTVTDWTAAGRGTTHTIHLTDAEGDYARARAAGDQQFIGMMGNALGLPGVEREYQMIYRDKYGVKVIDGISDVESGKTEKIRGPAHAYATTYNELLLKDLPSIEVVLKELEEADPAATQSP